MPILTLPQNRMTSTGRRQRNSMNTSGFYDTEDVLYPSDNTLDIPCLRIDRQAGHLAVPLAAYGTGRKMSKAKTVHFYVDDRSQCTAIEDAGIDYRKLKKDELLKIVLELTSPRIATTVIYENKPTRSDIHPTMKPVKLMARLIKNSSKPGQTVLDLFGGSGSTLIACEQLKRKCYTMELDPKYCDAILARWEKLTGMEATLASRGSNE